MMCYEVVVIGAGLFGSAAAKYAAEDFPQGSTILVGPGAGSVEDIDIMSIGSNFKNDNFLGGAWHDEGRITKLFEHGHTWQKFGKLL